VEIVSKNLNQRITLSYDEVISKTREAIIKWEEYSKSLDISVLKSINSNPLDYPLFVIGETLLYFGGASTHPHPNPLPEGEGKRGSQPFLDTSGDSIVSLQNDNGQGQDDNKNGSERIISKGFQLIIDSEIPLQSGLGSSSACAVAIVAALMQFFDQKYDKAVINEIASRAEKLQHGFPSGADVATSVYGGLMWFKKAFSVQHLASSLENDSGRSQNDNTQRIIEPLRFKIPEKIVQNFLIIDSGKPIESSGEMVGLVRKLYKEDQQKVETFLDSQGELVQDLAHALEEGDSKKMMEIITMGEKNLEDLGVVSEYVKQIIREIENSGGVAKMCGGGGKTHGTGVLLSYHPDLSVLQEVVSTLNLPYFQVELGGRGVNAAFS